GRCVQSVWQPGAPQPTRQPAEEDDAAAETEEAEGEGALRLPLSRGAAGHERPQSSEDEHVAAARAMAPSAGGLAREEVQKLQAALHDLTECRRLLDAALAGKNLNAECIDRGGGRGCARRRFAFRGGFAGRRSLAPRAVMD